MYCKVDQRRLQGHEVTSLINVQQQTGFAKRNAQAKCQSSIFHRTKCGNIII